MVKSYAGYQWVMTFCQFITENISGKLFYRIIDKTKMTPARILVLYVVAGVLLGGMGLYKYIADFGEAGATTPLTGFGFLIAKGVKNAVQEKGLLGALTGPLTAAAGGTAAALVFGYAVALICKGKPKD